MKQSRFLVFFALLLAVVTLTSCNGDDQGNTGGNIPFDERRAEQSVISIDTAKQYQANFIEGRQTLARQLSDTGYLQKSFNLPNAESFTRDALILLLNQKGADGVRVYYGKDNAGTVRLVLLPIDKNGRDIQTVLIDRGQQTNAISIPGVPSAKAAPPSQFQAVENGQTCPPCLID